MACFESSPFRPLCFFSVLDERAHYKKNMCFFCPARALYCCRFPKKNCQFREIKNIPKKNNSFWEITNIHQLCFFCLFFPSPSLPFLKKVESFFYFVALINFTRNLSNVIFYLDALINFSKNRLNVFFSLMFFFRPPLLDYGFFLI